MSHESRGRPSADDDSARHGSPVRHRLTEPLVLFPLIGALLLAVLAAATWNVVGLERRSAREAARSATVDAIDTYEAQVVRALLEIEQTLELVAYLYESGRGAAAFDEVSDRQLLPPDLLFAVTVLDPEGRVAATNRAGVFSGPAGDAAVGTPRWHEASGQWWLDFPRQLSLAAGASAGTAVVSVDAAYFVSGYEPERMGHEGMLGLIGRDGAFRVRRSGDTVSYAGRVDYERFVADPFAEPAEPVVVPNPWDGIDRYTMGREIFGFPLAVLVGLSEDEQLAAAEAAVAGYLKLATGAGMALLGVVALLGRMSWQLQRSRRRAMEEQVEHARRVEYLAFHDALTGLPNRSYFSKLLGHGIVTARRREEPFALMFVDLDRFKFINDTLGHDAGDELLREVARRLTGSVRESDTVARLGGDEFVVLLPDAGNDEELAAVARRILGAVRQTYKLAGQELRVTMSVGVAVYPRDGEDEETLMKHADVAMYHAKEEGKNNFQFYTRDLHAHSLERLSLESSLRHAVENDELRLFYQAKRDLTSGAITGVEALLRWQHPDLGLVQPMQFIPVAEETGLIVPIGRWVLETACRQSVAWRDAGRPPLTMAVNLSPRQFMDDDLLSDVAAALESTGMAPSLLELEITESMLMRDVPKAVKTLGRLKAMGVRIAIDDFGTGYSSLSALKQFPLDTIKIDGSFIGDIVTDVESQGLTRAIIAMGHTLSLTVIAECVESEAQVECLRAQSCDGFQGFLLNTPLPAEEFVALLESLPQSAVNG